ncbi:hypothetical protein RB601_006043 [Gaeumannomyces tritici]
MASASGRLNTGSAQQAQQLQSHGKVSKLELVAIPRAYAYHKVLGQKVDSDVGAVDENRSDESDESDESDGSDGWVDSKDTDDGDDEKGAKCGIKSGQEENIKHKKDVTGADRESTGSIINAAADGDDEDGQPMMIQPVKVEFGTLLVATPQEPIPWQGPCGNSKLRDGLWVVDPKFIRKLANMGMGFPSQLAQLCILAKLQTCGRDSCAAVKQAMDATAPTCGWTAFREWAIVAMSCQAAMDAEQKLSMAHTHLARAVSGLCMILKRCLRSRNRGTCHSFTPFLDNQREKGDPIDLAEVCNVIYWMARIQSQVGIGPRKFGRWDHHLLPAEVTLPSIESAVQAAEDMRICKNRLWNLVNVSDRKQGELPDIVAALDTYKESLRHDGHQFCTPNKCQWAQMNSTSVTQLHKCGGGMCRQAAFPVELLETALELGKCTAWLCKSAKLSGPGDPYIAISHVWSDGTGAGVKDPGTVNACLLDFFADIAQELGCKAVWWDALSIPYEPGARSKALNKMHANYANAEYTIVHDNYLLNFTWRDDGSPCLALVLSAWFTRGWTALELSISKRVKVLFKSPDTSNGGNARPVIKDLDDDVLARGPGVASRAHWLATTLIHRLRKPIGNVGDLLAILSPRSTSWVRDRTAIAALLVGVPDCDFTLGESLITTKVLEYLGKIPHACLLHGKSTMRNRGEYSWCAATLDDMPVDSSSDLAGGPASESLSLLEIDEAGAAEGRWRCRALQCKEVDKTKAYGNDLAAVVKVDIALQHWKRCLLLRHPFDRLDSKGSLALLVIPMSIAKPGPILECRYIGAVVEYWGQFRGDPLSDPWADGFLSTVRLGGTDDGRAGMLSEEVQDLMGGWRSGADASAAPQPDNTDESVHGDNDNGEPETAVVPAGRGQSVANPPLKTPKRLNPTRQVVLSRPLIVQNPPRELPRVDRDRLVAALRVKNEDAVRHLVSNSANLGAIDTAFLLKRLGGRNEGSLSRVKMLADIYADNGNLAHAIAMYHCIIDGYEGLASRAGKIGDPLCPLDSKYRLGSTYLRVQRASELEGGRLSSQSLSDNAQKLFDDVLARCDERSASTCRSAPERDPEHGEKKKNSRTGNSDVANQVKNELRWYRLEVNTIAELTLLHAARFDLGEAARAYRRALGRFGGHAEGNVEAFSGLWSARRGQEFGEKNKRDEGAAAVYQRALKRFDTMFHKNHILIAITSLNLGINYLLRSKFAQAEEQLGRAHDGFVEHFCGSASSHTMCDDEHAIIGLTLYHMGLLFTEQQRFNEARDQLEKARKIASTRQEDGTRDNDAAAIAEISAICALGRNELRRRRFDEADTRFERVTLMTLGQCVGDRARLAFQAGLGRAKVLHLGQRNSSAAAAAIANMKRLAAVPESGFSKPDLDICEAGVILSSVYRCLGRLDDAEAEVKQALGGYKILEGERSLDYLRTARRLGSIYASSGKKVKAEAVLARTYESLADTMGTLYPPTLRTSWQLGRLYLEQRKLSDADKACERAYRGFGKTLGPDNRSTAEAAQTLGSVYFEQGKFGRAKEMYDKAFSAFKATAGGPGHNKNPATMVQEQAAAAVTDRATLLCAMDLAKACSVFRDAENKKIAEKMYKLAERGLNAASKERSFHGLDAKLRLGAFYLEQGKLDEAEGPIRDAQAGFRELKRASATANEGPRLAEVKYLEAKLALGRLAQLARRKGREERRGESPQELIEDARWRLERLLGETDVLTLEASTVLGELYLEMPKERHRGNEMLCSVLQSYERGPEVPRGHPKRARIMETLIEYFVKHEYPKEAEEMKGKMWDELAEAYGVDLAAMIMDMMNLRRPSGGSNDEDEDDQDGSDDGEGAWNESDVSSWGPVSDDDASDHNPDDGDDGDEDDSDSGDSDDSGDSEDDDDDGDDVDKENSEGDGEGS